jgi:GWxTD domain-containing protein
MKKIISIFLICFLYSTASYSQGKLFFYTDYSLFKYTSEKSIIELYFSVNQRDLIYTGTVNNFTGQANIEISIFDKDKGKVVFDDFFGLQSKVNDTVKGSISNKLIGQQNFTLAPGEYLIKLIGSDFNNPVKCDTQNIPIVIPVFDNSKTSLSEIQLSTNITKSTDKNSIFYKYGLEVTPNPDALFGMNLNTLSYYLEIYNLNKDFSGENKYIITTVTDTSNNLLLRNVKHEESLSDAFVETGNLKIDSLNSNSYFLKIKLLDSLTGKYLEKVKKFFVYNKSKTGITNQNDEKNYLLSEYKTMTLEKLEDEFNKSIYIRTTPENNEYDKLKSVDEKRKFMFNFWKKRSYNPNSLLNEYKTEYFKKVNEANLLYKQGFIEGWKSDRGRIYITYGKPSEIESHPNEADTKGYEIWTYESIQGGAICIFAEREIGSGTYYLVHSTIRGELQDHSWDSKLGVKKTTDK